MMKAGSAFNNQQQSHQMTRKIKPQKTLNLNSQFILLLSQKLIQSQVQDTLQESQKQDNYELLPQLPPKDPSSSKQSLKSPLKERIVHSPKLNDQKTDLTLFELVCKSPENLEISKIALAEFLSQSLQIQQQQIFFQEYQSKHLILAFRALFNIPSETSIQDIILLFAGQYTSGHQATQTHHQPKNSQFSFQTHLQQQSQIPSYLNSTQRYQNTLNSQNIQNNLQNTQNADKFHNNNSQSYQQSYIDSSFKSSQQPSQINSLNQPISNSTNNNINTNQAFSNNINHENIHVSNLSSLNQPFSSHSYFSQQQQASSNQQQIVSSCSNGLNFNQVFLVLLFNLAEDCQQLAQLLYLFGQQTYKQIVKSSLFMTYQQLQILAQFFYQRSQIEIIRVLRQFNLSQQDEINFKQAELVLFYFVKEEQQNKQIRQMQINQANSHQYQLKKTDYQDTADNHQNKSLLTLQFPRYLKSQVQANQLYERMMRQLEVRLDLYQCGSNAASGSITRKQISGQGYGQGQGQGQDKEQRNSSQSQSQSQSQSENQQEPSESEDRNLIQKNPNTTKPSSGKLDQRIYLSQQQKVRDLKDLRENDKSNLGDSSKKCALI